MCDCCLQEFNERELNQVEEDGQILNFCDECYTVLTAPTESSPEASSPEASSTESSEGEPMDEE